MKRSAHIREVDLDSDDTLIHDGPTTSDGRTVEKRARSGSPPLYVGPLVFTGNGHGLQTAVFNAQPSIMPGVHRLTSPEPSPSVRLWSPHLAFPQFIEASLQQVLQAINGKCIFLFDTRKDAAEVLLGNLSVVHFLSQSETIRKFGIFCSRQPLGQDLTGLPVAYVQDPNCVLAQLCKFHDYLGPSAVLAKDGQVVATCMLSRSPEAVLETFEQWATI